MNYMIFFQRTYGLDTIGLRYFMFGESKILMDAYAAGNPKVCHAIDGL
jgi:hypothetical protein